MAPTSWSRFVDATSGVLVSAVLAGLLTGLSLIIAIGAQNAYVLRLGLSRHHMGVAVAICVAADLSLIGVGVAGLGALVQIAPWALRVLKWVGVVYVGLFAAHSLWRARAKERLEVADAPAPSARAVVLSTLGFTLLNPHVYLDTVLLISSIASQYGSRRWLFALGAGLASTLWFSVLGFGSRLAAPIMRRPSTWRVLDIAIGVVMLGVAINLARLPLAS